MFKLLLVASCAVGFQQPLPSPVLRRTRVARPVTVAEVDTTLLMGFADQGSNLAGKFFQGSLVPYLGFLYFLNYPKNKTPPLVSFGFGYLLLFVLATIPTGIISKSTWGVSLADCDWLHGGAESLLTVTNVLIVLGFRRALRGEDESSLVPKLAAGACLAAVVGLVAAGVPALHLDAHDPFLGGLGDLQLPDSNEPVNALSIPTWAVHFSSVAEFVVAIGLANDYAKATGNPKWQGFAFGMLPSHASGICACVYHLFYNQKDMAWLVTTQAGLTFLGNCTLFIAALRLALSNGWTLQEAFGRGEGEAADENGGDLVTTVSVQPSSDSILFAEVAAFAFVCAYATKYGSLAGLDFLTSPQNVIAAVSVLASPAVVANALLTGDGGGGDDQDNGVLSSSS